MKTTNYFSHDSNSRNDEKLLAVRMRLGAEGYGVYFMILERLREEVDYMSVKDYNLIAFDLRVSSSVIKSVIEDFGLFEFNGEKFYSTSFLKRMQKKDEVSKKRAESGQKGAKKRWEELPENQGINSKAMANATNSDSKTMANATNFDGKESKVKESKVKKEKEKKEKPTAKPPPPPQKSKQALLREREKRFKADVLGFSEYPRELLLAFFDYWSEPNGSGTKMLFETKPTFEIGRRLRTWASRDFGKNRRKQEFSEHPASRYKQKNSDVDERF